MVLSLRVGQDLDPQSQVAMGTDTLLGSCRAKGAQTWEADNAGVSDLTP